MNANNSLIRAAAAFFLAAVCLAAQHRVETIAGGVVRSGVPGRDIEVKLGDGMSVGPAGQVVFADQSNTIRVIGADGNVSTLAGTGFRGFSPDGTLATQANLDDPAFPIMTEHATFFVDRGNYRIRYIDDKARIMTLVGTGYARAGDEGDGAVGPVPIRYVTDMVMAPSGNLYFADSDRVRRVESNGQVTTVVPKGGGPAFTGQKLAADGLGNVYAYDSVHIVRLAQDGTTSLFAGSETATFERGPFLQEGARALDVFLRGYPAIAGATEGGIYVSSAYKIAVDGILHAVPGGASLAIVLENALAYAAGRGLVVGHGGGLNQAYLIDLVQNDGTVINLAGAAPKRAPDGMLARDAWLLSPVSMAVASTGEIYVAERTICDIRKIGLDGRISTLAGSGVCAPADNRPRPTNAQADLPPPHLIVTDMQNRVWVSDDYGDWYRIEADGTFYYPPYPNVLVGAGTAALTIDAAGRTFMEANTYLLRIHPNDGKYDPIVPSGTMGGLGRDRAGNVYFAGQLPGSNTVAVYRVNDDGTYTRVSAGSLGEALGWPGAAALAKPSWTRSNGDGPLAQVWFEHFRAADLSPSGDLIVLDGDRVRKITGSDPAARPSILSGGIVNALSYTGGGTVAPGEIIAIFGSNFGSDSLLQNDPVNNQIPRVARNTRVFVNDIPAPILAVTPTQINAVVPSTPQLVAGAARVVVQVDAATSDAAPVTVAPASFGLASANSSGSGQGAIVNEGDGINSVSNPAPAGSVVSLFGTGVQLPNGAPADGAILLSPPYPQTDLQTKVTIGGKQAEVQYFGAAPALVWGAIQVNARIPAGLGPGSCNVVVSVAGVDSPPVTLAVR